MGGCRGGVACVDRRTLLQNVKWKRQSALEIRNPLQASPLGDFCLCGGLLEVGEALCCNEG